MIMKIFHLFMREMTTVKTSEYSPDAMDSKHSRAVNLDPMRQRGQGSRHSCLEPEPEPNYQQCHSVESGLNVLLFGSLIIKI